MTPQQRMDEFFATHVFDKTPGDWRTMPETEPKDDEPEQGEKE
jgi:hypothetical protein